MHSSFQGLVFTWKQQIKNKKNTFLMDVTYL